VELAVEKTGEKVSARGRGQRKDCGDDDVVDKEATKAGEGGGRGTVRP
jgi:hypothetical protein